MSFWTDKEIAEWAQRGGVTPFDPSVHTTWLGSPGRLINPASLDMRLDNTVRRLRIHDEAPILDYGANDADTVWHKLSTFETLVMNPGDVALLSTVEFVRIPSNAIALIFLKSSAARRGFEALHAGVADGGFNGQLTLEIVNMSRVAWRLRPGDRLVQLIIGNTNGEPLNTYEQTGRYSGQIGATAFRKERDR